MAEAFDTRLTDPDARAVLAALAHAAGVVNSYGPATRLNVSNAALKRVADRTAAEPEGMDFWLSTTDPVSRGVVGQLLAAWWTTAFGVRHVRVLARFFPPGTALPQRTQLATRPPLWHVFPDRVYRRRVGAANDLVVVCGCGAVGTEKSLSWAGECCGPCFDRQEELGALPVRRPALLAAPEPMTTLAFSTDGRWVAAGSGLRVVAWDLDAGANPVRAIADLESSPRPFLALNADGSRLAVSNGSFTPVLVFDLTADSPTVVARSAGAGAVASNPRRGLLLTRAGKLVRTTGWHMENEAEVADADEDSPLAVSRDGRFVATLAEERLVVRETSRWTEVARFTGPREDHLHARASRVRGPNRPPWVHVAFAPDGAGLVIGTGCAVEIADTGTGGTTFAEMDLGGDVAGVAWDTAGEWVYVGRFDGSLTAYRAADPDRDPVTLRWHLGPIRALALAADGETLATAGDEGVKLWPVRRLLEGC